MFSRRTLINLSMVFFGILLYFALTNYTAILSLLSRIVTIFSPFLYGIILAFLLHMPMVFFEEKVFKNFKGCRVLSIVSTYICTLVAIFLLFWLVVPQIIESVRSLVGNLNLYLDNLNNLLDYFGHQFSLDSKSIDEFRLSYEDLLDMLMAMIREMLPDILDFSMKLGTGVVRMLTAFIASVYILASKDMLMRQCRRTLYAFVPKGAADESVRILRLSVRMFTGFIGGKVLESLIIGVVCFIGMTLMNAIAVEMPFIPLITVIIAVTNVIPFFGPFIGAIPSTMILLIINPISALWFIVFIIIIQQLDGNILGPRILADSTGLPPLWVLVAIVVGGGLFGFAGMVAGVPVVAVLYTLVHELVNGRLRKAGLNEDAHVEIVNVADKAETNAAATGDAAETGAETNAPGEEV